MKLLSALLLFCLVSCGQLYMTCPDAVTCVPALNLTQGNGITITGSNPNYTITSGGSTNIVETYTISNTQILNSFTTPINISQTPTANQFISLVSVLYDFRFSGSAFATNTNGRIGYQTGTTTTMCTANINKTANTLNHLQQAYGTGATTDSNTLLGQPLQFFTQTGNPTGGGDSYIIFKVEYQIIDYPF